MTQKKKYPISVIMVASNEEKNLPRVLGSVADWVTEIVLVINNCQDRTEEIGRNFGARVFEHAWTNYGQQVEWAIQQATQPWILVLDADEEVSPSLAKEIQDFLEQDNQLYNGARCPRCTYFLGRWIRHGDWYPDYVYRLFRSGKGKSILGDHGGIRIEGKIYRLKSDLYHYPFPHLRTELLKIARFAESFAREKQLQWSLSHCLMRPLWRFFRSYILRLGFLDGFPGFYVAIYIAYSTFIRYSRFYPPLQSERYPSSPEKEKHTNK